MKWVAPFSFGFAAVLHSARGLPFFGNLMGSSELFLFVFTLFLALDQKDGA
jgi:hypothetical protein